MIVLEPTKRWCNSCLAAGDNTRISVCSDNGKKEDRTSIVLCDECMAELGQGLEEREKAREVPPYAE